MEEESTVNITEDDDILNYMLSVFYADGSYMHCHLPAFKELLPHCHKWDIDRLFYKLVQLGFIIKITTRNDIDVWRLSYNGMELLRKYGSYTNYINQTKEKEEKKLRDERIDRNIRNGNIIAALVISAVAVILTQFPKDNKEQLNKIETHTQSIQYSLDSLLKKIYSEPLQPQTQKTKDTATNK